MMASISPSSESTTSVSGRSKSIEPAPPPPRVQYLEQLPHQLEHRHELDVSRRRRFVAVRENRVDVRICHPRIAVDHSVVDLVADDVAVPIDFHHARLHQAIDVRVQAAQSGRQLRRKHVHGALGKIDRRPALVRFLVERAALLHIVRDVSDVHSEPVVAVRQPLNRDRVVEVARMFAVDRDGRHRHGNRSARGCRDP